jgi:hypothetical protein
LCLSFKVESFVLTTMSLRGSEFPSHIPMTVICQRHSDHNYETEKDSVGLVQREDPPFALGVCLLSFEACLRECFSAVGRLSDIR